MAKPAMSPSLPPAGVGISLEVRLTHLCVVRSQAAEAAVAAAVAFERERLERAAQLSLQVAMEKERAKADREKAAAVDEAKQKERSIAVGNTQQAVKKAVEEGDD